MIPICFTLNLFLKVNNELHKVSQWFISNKVPLNIKKQSIQFSINEVKKDSILPLLPKLKTNNYEIKWAESIKFIGRQEITRL